MTKISICVVSGRSSAVARTSMSSSSAPAGERLELPHRRCEHSGEGRHDKERLAESVQLHANDVAAVVAQVDAALDFQGEGAAPLVDVEPREVVLRVV